MAAINVASSCSWHVRSSLLSSRRRKIVCIPIRASQDQQTPKDESESTKILLGSGLSAAEAAVAVALDDAGASSEAVEIGVDSSRDCKVWTWRGLYKINYIAVEDSGGPAVLLIHGFGASIGHFRRNIPVLAKDHSVFAIDLLGLGASEKPLDFSYTIEAWRELVLDFIKEVMRSTPTVLVGNSIGSLVCLAAAADASEGLVRGIVLLNCAGGMNNKAVVDDWRMKLFTPLLWLIDRLLLQPGISARLFNRVKSKENLRTVLSSVYCNKEAVDDELIEIIQKPAEDPGALQAFVSIITGPPGPTPMSLMDKITSPLLILWGDTDPFTPVDGPVGKYFTSLPSSRPDVQLQVLKDVGHCPHDDRPELVHEQLLPWLAGLST